MNIRIKAEGPTVFLAFDDRTFVTLEPHVAKMISAGLREKALVAEEYLKAEQVIRDGAILARAGAPFSLSKRFKAEIVKEASWGDIRRYMPLVRSSEKFGTPTIVQHSPEGEKHGNGS